MNIRTATTDDVEGIRRVARESWEHDYPEILSRETVESGFETWYGAEQIQQAVEDPLAIVPVAESDGAVVGFAHGLLDGDVGTILRLYVHPDHRRVGIGSRLFEETKARFTDQDVELLRAMVLAPNDPGNEFYRKLGFERVDSAETTIGGDTFAENTYERRLDR
jgi:ribosomal protein S18 acetylase RimI-like enzyme